MFKNSVFTQMTVKYEIYYGLLNRSTAIALIYDFGYVCYFLRYIIFKRKTILIHRTISCMEPLSEY